MAAILNFVIISCFAVQATAVKIAGTEAWRLNDQLVLEAAPAEKEGESAVPGKKEVNWTSWDHWTGFGAGAAVGGVVVGAIVFFLLSRVSGQPKEVEEESGEETKDVEAAAEEEAPVEEAEPETKSADAQALMQLMAQKIAQDVGPKLEKGGAIRNVLEARVANFQDKAKNMLMNEMDATAGEVLKELEAPESMLLLDWNAAVEANFPPAPVLLAGALTPACLKLMSFHHLLQGVTVGLPMTILCVAAVLIDWSAPCPSIPTIFGWLYTQTILALCLFFGHLIQFTKINAGKAKLEARAQEIQDQQVMSVSGMRDQFVSQTILLQEALLIEQDIRASIWNKIVGVATSAWLITTIWTLVLVVGWTFVPGVVAFHPAAAKEAPEAYCGTWMTVLVMKVSVLLALLYFFFNLGTIVQFLCDLMIESEGFQSAVLSQARKMDGGGLPVVELLVKALVFRGGSDTMDAKIAVTQNERKTLEKQQAELENQQQALQRELERITVREEMLKAKIEKDGGGNLAAQVSKLSEGAVSYDTWRQHGDRCIEEAEAKAKDVQEATTTALEALYEKINGLIDAAQNTEAAQALKAKAAEAEEAARQGMANAQDLAQQAMDKANDPEFQKQLQEQANKAREAAQKAADQAKAAATDPELQKKLAEAAQKATDQAQSAADQAKSAASSSSAEMQQNLTQAAQKATEQAKKATEQAKKAGQDAAKKYDRN